MENGDESSVLPRKPCYLSDAMDAPVVLPHETIELWAHDGLRAPRTDVPTELAGAIFATLVHPLLDTLFNLLRRGSCKLVDLDCIPESLESLGQVLETQQPWTQVIETGLDKIALLNQAISQAEFNSPQDRYQETDLLDPLREYFDALVAYEQRRWEDLG